MSNDNLDPLRLENQLCFPLYAASREIIKRYRPFLDELELTYTQYITMMVFWQKGSISVKQLGQILYLDSGTLTPVLKHLESKKYITRSRCPEDERVLIAKIAPEGVALKKRAASVPGNISCCIKLDEEERKTLYSLLYKLLDGCE